MNQRGNTNPASSITNSENLSTGSIAYFFAVPPSTRCSENMNAYKSPNTDTLAPINSLHTLTPIAITHHDDHR
jgi:hypothetical protein